MNAGPAEAERHRLPDDPARAIAQLETMCRIELTERWQALYRTRPPKGVGRRFLIGAVAFELQMRRAGKSTARIHRRLERQARAQDSDVAPRTAAAARLRAGARLIREWNGATHVVDVTADGFVWNGAQHRSLSAIARAITGARWSGPRFFGLDRENERE